METLKAAYDAFGHISTIIVIVSAIYGAILWFRGIVPVLIRLGNGLARRKIAIFAKGDNLTSLETVLNDSKLFNKVNVLKIPTTRDIGIAEGATLFLVYWPDWKDEIENVIAKKADETALIVYAPQDQGLIPKDTMAVLDRERNVVVNNFRGRLLNDIVVSLITTSYEKK